MQLYPIDLLASRSVQEFIFQNERLDTRNFVLRNRGISGVPAPVIADQISGRRKSKIKIPEFYSTPGIIYPPTLNLEQSSSSETARFKIEHVLRSTEKRLAIDLTGGFGVDTFFLSKEFDRVIYVEPNASLLEIARHNHLVLGATNVEYHCMRAEDFMASSRETPDVIFIDPSRRVHDKKVAGMRDSIPDITRMQEDLSQKTSFFLVKASPLMDIKAALDDLICIREVFVVSVDNDCKELLFLGFRGHTNPATVHAINIGSHRFEELSFQFKDERDAKPEYSSPFKYLYEPNVSILKAGAFKFTAQYFKLAKLDPNSHLYTSSDLNSDFPGRIFQVEAFLPADAKSVGDFFSDRKANVLARNYPLSVDGLKSRLKLADGGEKYLIATTSENKKLLIAASRIK